MEEGKEGVALELRGELMGDFVVEEGDVVVASKFGEFVVVTVDAVNLEDVDVVEVDSSIGKSNCRDGGRFQHRNGRK